MAFTPLAACGHGRQTARHEPCDRDPRRQQRSGPATLRGRVRLRDRLLGRARRPDARRSRFRAARRALAGGLRGRARPAGAQPAARQDHQRRARRLRPRHAVGGLLRRTALQRRAARSAPPGTPRATGEDHAGRHERLARGGLRSGARWRPRQRSEYRRLDAARLRRSAPWHHKRMSTLQKSVAAVLLVLLLATGYGLWATNDAGGAPVQQKTAIVVVGKDKGVPVIDQHTLLIAQRLARYASTPEEQPLAQQAVQIADHELDLAFAATLHHLESHPPPLSPEAAKIQRRLDELQKQLSADTATLKQLNDQLSKASAADKPALQDRVDLTQSQVELEQDEVDEANSDLLQAGGNVHQRIQQMQQEHQAAEHAAASLPAAAPSGALSQLKGMVGEIRQWLALRRKQR